MVGVWLYTPPVQSADADPQYFYGRTAVVKRGLRGLNVYIIHVWVY
jgi:hypothetical protein